MKMRISLRRICLALAAAVSVMILIGCIDCAYAVSTWPSFRGNPENNGVVDFETPIVQEETEPVWVDKFGESATGMSGWTYAPNMPLVIDGDIITISNKTVYRVDAATGEVIKKSEEELPARPNWGNTPMTYVEDEDRKYIFCPLGGGYITCIDAETFEQLWTFSAVEQLGTKNNQSLSGVVYSDGIAYTGFYMAYDMPHYYVAIAVKEMSLPDPETGVMKDYKPGDLIWKYESGGGFYFNGGVAIGDAIIVGTQDGLANNDVTGVSGLGLADAYIIAFDKKTGNKISDIRLTDASDICSSIVHEKPASGNTGHLYWTSCGGFMFSAEVNETTGEISNVKQKAIPGTNPLTISTPALYKDRLYIGYKTKTDYGFFAAYDKNSLQEIYRAELRGYPKSSPLITTAYEDSTGYLYAYVSYYEKPGGLQVIRFRGDATDASDEEQVKVSDLFDANGYDQYGISSVVADDRGQLYYKNDSNALFAIGKCERVVLGKATGLKLTPSGTKITVSVNSMNGATGYRVLYQLNGKGSFKKAEFSKNKGTITVPNSSYVTVKVRAEHIDAAKIAYGAYSDTAMTYAAKSTIKALTGGKRSFTVKFDKHAKANGYQIQYSLKKSMKSPKTLKKTGATKVRYAVKKLKTKKIYYVRVRSYRKVNGKTVNGKWSAIRKIRTK